MRRRTGRLLRRMEQLEEYAGRRPEATGRLIQNFLHSLSDIELKQLLHEVRENTLFGPEEKNPPREAVSLAELSPQENRELLAALQEWRENFQRGYREEYATCPADN